MNQIATLSYEEAIEVLKQKHLYPERIYSLAQTGEVVGLKIKTSPHYKDDRLLLMKGLLPKEFKLKWNKVEEAIMITKS